MELFLITSCISSVPDRSPGVTQRSPCGAPRWPRALSKEKTNRNWRIHKCLAVAREDWSEAGAARPRSPAAVPRAPRAPPAPAGAPSYLLGAAAGGSELLAPLCLSDRKPLHYIAGSLLPNTPIILYSAHVRQNVFYSNNKITIHCN